MYLGISYCKYTLKRFFCVLFLIDIFCRFTGVYKHWQDIPSSPPGGGLASHLHSRGRSGKYKNILRETEVCVKFGFFLSFLQYHIDRGSKISLVCVIENAPEPPQWVWFFFNLAQFSWVSHVTLPFSLRSVKTFFFPNMNLFSIRTSVVHTYVRWNMSFRVRFRSLSLPTSISWKKKRRKKDGKHNVLKDEEYSMRKAQRFAAKMCPSSVPTEKKYFF